MTSTKSENDVNSKNRSSNKSKDTYDLNNLRPDCLEDKSKVSS